MSRLIRSLRLAGGVVGVALLTRVPGVSATGEDDRPPSPPAAAHPEAEQAAKLVRLPPGLAIDVWAKEPQLRNPVGFAFDERGGAYVVETFRFGGAGTLDNGERAAWLSDAFKRNASRERMAGISREFLDHELGARTVEDRMAMIREYLDIGRMTATSDRIKLVEDTDGDGHADRDRIFAAGFYDPLDGVAASVLPYRGDVFFTDIPRLWLLRDTNGDGIADSRRALHAGFGVRFGYLGHDLHGLRMGPDGRLYFSVGDRGAAIRTMEGRTIAVPDTGAVFRCELDGSGLELFASGLRNPQDLVFDDRGNLFTGDNNADRGDRARWVYVVEGGDSGWRLGYQYLERGGPWVREKIWQKRWDGQPADIVPPVDHVGSGPAGVAYFPGTGLPASYRGRFFMADWATGQASGSGIWSFNLRASGAGFEMQDLEKTFWGVLPTDVDFGAGAGIYVLDWVAGHTLPGKGRIFRVYDPRLEGDPAIAETRRLLAEGMGPRPETELLRLLAHADLRVRQEAQFELVRRQSSGVLTTVATAGAHPVARLHALWALGQLLRAGRAVSAGPLVGLVDDGDAEVRAQAIKMLGDARVLAATDAVRRRLFDPNPRVQSFAALAMGKMGLRASLPDLLTVLEANADRDPILRHAAVMGLAGVADAPALLAASSGRKAAARLGVLLALRRKGSAEVRHFLSDPDPLVVREAARAINDTPIEEATPALATATRAAHDEPTLLRVVNANFRLGTIDAAKRLTAIALRAESPPAARAAAVEGLADWAEPSGRDRVTGAWRPLPAGKRDAHAAALALQRSIVVLLRDEAGSVRLAAARACRSLSLASGAETLAAIVSSSSGSAALRLEALAALATLNARALPAALTAAAEDADPQLRVAALRTRVSRDPSGAASLIGRAMEEGTVEVKQAAFGLFAALPATEADTLLARWMDDLLAGKIPRELTLDLLEAAAARNTPALKAKRAAFDARRSPDEVGHFAEALAGGNGRRGHGIFDFKAEVWCVRCHRTQGFGGEGGPVLDGIGKKRSREYILESIVAPNKRLAEGFESTILTLTDGSLVAGILKRDGGDTLEVLSSEPGAGVVAIKKADVKSHERGASGMPDGFGDILTRRELRDLVEYLASLTSEP